MVSGQPGAVGDVGESTVAVVAVQTIGRGAAPAVTGHEQVAVAIAVVIEKQRGPSAPRVEQASLSSYVGEGAVAIIAIEVMGILNADGEQIAIAIAIIIAPSAAAAAGQGIDAKTGSHIRKDDRGRGHAIRVE